MTEGEQSKAIVLARPPGSLATRAKRHGEELLQLSRSRLAELQQRASASASAVAAGPLDGVDFTAAAQQLLSRVASKPTLHKSFSDSNFLHLRTTVRRPISVAARPTAMTLQHAASESTPAWLQAINSTLVAARAAQQQQAQAMEQQAARLVQSASARDLQERLSSVKEHLLARPRDALSSAQATLGHCHQNLRALHTNLQASLAEGRSSLERTLASLGEPGSPSSSGSRLAALLSPVRNSGSGCSVQRAADVNAIPQELDQPSDPLAPWAVLPGYMRARETAAIEALSASEDEETAEELPSTSGQRWGPFQQQQAARRQRVRSAGGSSLREAGRQVTIVTTAALPWMTGTAVNPLLRAAYLARNRARRVTLMIPWLAKADQGRVFPNGITFDTPEQQEAYVRDWVSRRTGFDADFKVTFYPGRYAPEKCSILPVGDPTQYIPEHEVSAGAAQPATASCHAPLLASAIHRQPPQPATPPCPAPG